MTALQGRLTRIACLLAVLTVVANIRAAAADAVGTSRLDLIKASRSVRVCVWPDYHGISYRNPKTQEFIGIDSDLAIEFGKDLGVEVRFVDSSFATLIDDVTRDRCDIAMFAVGITPLRQEKLRFTRPHLVSDIYAITSKTNQRIGSWADIDKPGAIVAVARGTLHESVMRERLRAAQLLILDTPFAREQEVQAGRADVFMTDYPYSIHFMANADWARLVSPPDKYHITRYAYAMKPGDDIWYARVERFMTAIRHDGRLMAAARRHKLEAIVIP